MQHVQLLQGAQHAIVREDAGTSPIKEKMQARYQPGLPSSYGRSRKKDL
jgi:hypothetical protein